ncbi:MAG: phosphoribosyl-ATP diphosphatase [Proteobacteria bacterium]|nr:phosphoribosyl-ATP diphosphatase [Pseudomonadota bacterium]
MSQNTNFSLEKLFAQMQSNAKNLSAEQSYTARLAALESEDVTKKFMEEAYEVSLAAVEHQRHNGGEENLVNEACDVIYHLLAVLVNRDIDFNDVLAELEKRNNKLK